MNLPIRTQIVFLSALVTLTAGGAQSAHSQPPQFVAVGPAPRIAQRQPVASAASSTEPAGSGGAVRSAAFQESSRAAEATPATVPPVLLTAQHKALCRVNVGDPMPDVELPRVEGGTAKLSSLQGKAATVVVFWKSDRRMTWDELTDLGPDVVELFGPEGVAVVGVAVQEQAGKIREVLRATEAKFPHLVDADGKAFARVGAERLPWTLVLDSTGKIVWFDLEYSHATRRELQQALLALTR